MTAAVSGIGDGVQVVVYTQELPTFAARLWWLLRYYGFETVSVLDGGLAAWRTAELPVTGEPTSPPAPANFVAWPRPEMLART
jgi:thiosulfate/3-mercaptopyruvate sulfurtransferase